MQNPSYWARIFPFLVWSKNITSKTLKADIFAGITGAIVVLPQGVAYALIAGVPPEYGLYAAIVPAIVAALMGSSWHLVSGPTAALSIIVFASISPLAEPGSPEFINLVLALTLMAGVFQLILALLRMGSLINFVSHSVILGFTSGAALVIATSQMKHFFNLPYASSGNFISNWMAFSDYIWAIHWPSFMIGTFTLIICLLFQRYLPRWPYMLIAMVLGAAATAGLNIANIAGADLIKSLGSIPASLPRLSVPEISLATLRELAPSAMALGLFGLVEAVSISRSIGIKSGQQISGNQEFRGQAFSNIIGSFMSSYASSGSFTRSGINYEAGAQTPLASIIAAIVLMLIILVLAPLAAYITLPSMAAILFIVAWKLISWQPIATIFRSGKTESSIFLVTFFTTLILPIEIAIYIGVLLSLVLYLRRTSKPEMMPMIRNKETLLLVNSKRANTPECDHLKIIRLDGSIFFGAVNYIQARLGAVPQQHILIVMSGVNFIDLAGTHLLADMARSLRHKGGGLYLCNIKGKVIKTIIRNGDLAAIGRDNIFSNKSVAFKRLRKRMGEHRCEGCEHMYIPVNISKADI